jgi:hypothetical protein
MVGKTENRPTHFNREKVCMQMLQETCSPSVLLFPPAVPGRLLFPATCCSRPPAVHGLRARGFTGNNDLLTTENTKKIRKKGRFYVF